MKPLDRIGVIRQSLVVFNCGLLGFLPLIGLLPAAYALVRGYQVRRAYSEFNPASKYLKWGIALGVFGILLSFLVALSIGLSVVSQDHQTENTWGN